MQLKASAERAELLAQELAELKKKGAAPAEASAEVQKQLSDLEMLQKRQALQAQVHKLQVRKRNLGFRV